MKVENKAVGKAKRHSWEKLDKNGYMHRCRHCRMKRFKIPHPYARLWITEWTPANGESFTQDKTPPCAVEGSEQ